MAGTLPGVSMSQQLDEFGVPLAGGHIYFIQAGTVSMPQNAFQDSALTLPLPNPIILSASGRIPAFWLADGSIKIRLTDVNGVEVPGMVVDGLAVVGASSGGGGGSPVDATTIFSTGDIKPRYGTGIHTGWVRSNGRTIGSATSGASERANSDTQALFEYLWNTDVNLAVSTGRGASSILDWGANKNITLPDWRGRALAALDDMGNSAAGRLTVAGFGVAATVLGAASTPTETKTLLTANLPAYTPAGSVTGTVSYQSVLSPVSGSGTTLLSPGGAAGAQSASLQSGLLVGTPQGGTSTPLAIVQPTMLATIYLKL